MIYWFYLLFSPTYCLIVYAAALVQLFLQSWHKIIHFSDPMFYKPSNNKQECAKDDLSTMVTFNIIWYLKYSRPDTPKVGLASCLLVLGSREYFPLYSCLIFLSSPLISPSSPNLLICFQPTYILSFFMDFIIGPPLSRGNSRNFLYLDLLFDQQCEARTGEKANKVSSCRQRWNCEGDGPWKLSVLLISCIWHTFL